MSCELSGITNNFKTEKKTLRFGTVKYDAVEVKNGPSAHFCSTDCLMVYPTVRQTLESLYKYCGTICTWMKYLGVWQSTIVYNFIKGQSERTSQCQNV